MPAAVDVRTKSRRVNRRRMFPSSSLSTLWSPESTLPRTPGGARLARWSTGATASRRAPRRCPAATTRRRRSSPRRRRSIFSRRWICAGRADALPQPGDYALREVSGESLILVRGRDGRLRAFYNVCRHRGTRLCETASGRFAGGIQCPYHAWTYSPRRRADRRAPHGRRAVVRPERASAARGGRRGMGGVSLRQPGRAARTAGGRPPAAPGPLRAVAPFPARGRAPGRVRRAGQLEADLPELLGVLPLPARPPRPRSAFALPQRRQRPAGRRRSSAATCSSTKRAGA